VNARELGAAAVAESEWRAGPALEGSQGREPFIGFRGDGTIYGFTGCNRFVGTYEEQGEALKLSPLGMTKMACLDEKASEREKAFIDALGKARARHIAPMELRLLDESGTALLILQRRVSD
jgi:heat shock protein HslJ